MQASVSSQTASPVDYLLVFVTSFLLWLLLTASLDPQELVAGAVVALIVTALTGDRAAIINGLRLTPTAPLGLVKYLSGRFIDNRPGPVPFRRAAVAGNGTGQGGDQ